MTPATVLHPVRRSRQRGSALIATLLLLLVSMLMALGSLRLAQVDERMVGNTRDRQVALQYAEAALRDAEQVISTDASGPFSPLLPGSFTPGCPDAYCRSSEADPLWADLTDGDWTGSRTWAYGAATGAPPLDSAVQAPRMLIEYQGTVQPIEQGKPCVAFYLLTARASGVNRATDVIVQSVFRHRVGECHEEI